jgi:hypothetical protein
VRRHDLIDGRAEPGVTLGGVLYLVMSVGEGKASVQLYIVLEESRKCSEVSNECISPGAH